MPAEMIDDQAVIEDRHVTIKVGRICPMHKHHRVLLTMPGISNGTFHFTVFGSGLHQSSYSHAPHGSLMELVTYYATIQMYQADILEAIYEHKLHISK